MADLRAPIPQEHIHNAASHQDIIESNPFLLRILSKIYIANYTLQLSTETRFTSFQLFHRCLSHYIHYNLVRHMTPQGNSNSNSYPTSNSSSERNINISLLQRQELSKLAAASIFLACKLCNEQRRIRDVINIQHVLQMQEIDGLDAHLHPPKLDEQYWESKRDMVKMEQTLLRIILFDVNVSHPHRIMVVLWEEIINNSNSSDSASRNMEKADMNCWKIILKSAWKRLNDSLFHVDSLMCSAPSLACASLSLALDEVPNHSVHFSCEWWGWLDVKYEEMMEVKIKLLQAARISKILVPSPDLL